jgi:hypothetical protein
VYQIPDRRAPEVVPEHRPDLRAPAGPLPCAAEIFDPFPPVPPPEVREEMRDGPTELPLEGPHLRRVPRPVAAGRNGGASRHLDNGPLLPATINQTFG